jgi:hypothetical protein
MKPISTVISSLIDLKEKKRHALIIFGVQESSFSDEIEGKEHDSKSVDRIIRYLGFASTCIAGIYRFRKNQLAANRTPPIRVVLEKTLDRSDRSE